MDMVDRIFVQIPAYRDAELAATLRDLLAKADAPEALRIVVAWQHAPGEALDADVATAPQVELMRIPHERSRGCNWARRLIQRKWRGEPFTLLLDSHHRFAPGWDRLLRDMHAGLKARGVAKPLLTGYLPPYLPPGDPDPDAAPMQIYPLGREWGVLSKLTSRPMPFWRSRTAPVPASFLSLHFAFAAGEFNAEAPFDPGIYFLGDETLLGLRAFTHGYDLFHPHRVIGWHAYDRGARTPHWDDHPLWFEQHFASLRRIRAIVNGAVRGRFGFGARRSLADYEDMIMMKVVEA
jgi:hypothetical protein